MTQAGAAETGGIRDRGDGPDDLPQHLVPTRTWTAASCRRSLRRSRALKMGLAPQQVTVHGLPIRPAFSANQQPKAALRKEQWAWSSPSPLCSWLVSHLSIHVLLAVLCASIMAPSGYKSAKGLLAELCDL